MANNIMYRNTRVQSSFSYGPRVIPTALQEIRDSFKPPSSPTYLTRTRSEKAFHSETMSFEGAARFMKIENESGVHDHIEMYDVNSLIMGDTEQGSCWAHHDLRKVSFVLFRLGPREGT